MHSSVLDVLNKMALSCLKYSLAFLLGATSLAIFIFSFVQLQANVIRVDIRWRNDGGLSGKSSSLSSAAEQAAGKSSINHIRASELSTLTDGRGVRAGGGRDSAIQPLDRSARQQAYSSSMKPTQNHNTLTKRGRDQLLKNTRTNNSRRQPKSTGKQQSQVSIEEALSSHKTAPDWVGPTLPPVNPSDTDAVCEDRFCMDRLTEEDKSLFSTCTDRAGLKEKKIGPITLSNDSCHFQNGTTRHPVALASFPGSGNTWMRGLLQKITGVCTGAIYCDTVLKARGFPGEFIRGSSVIAVKVHGLGGLFTHGKLPRRIFNHAPIYGAAIFLVRDPRSALVADWHRKKTKKQTNTTSSSHSLYAGQEKFKNHEGWNAHVEEKGKRWSDHITGWIISGKDNPFHIVQYEDLKNDTVKEMKKVMDFLGFSHLSEADIAERLDQGYNNFYRNHKDDFVHFTEEQKAFVHEQVVNTINTLKEYGLENVFPIYKYL